jgi:hypothetical protein
MRYSERESSQENNDKAEIVIPLLHIVLQGVTHEQDKTKSMIEYFTIPWLSLKFRSLWAQT